MNNHKVAVMKFKYLYIAAAIFFSFQLKAQDEAVHTQYMLNPAWINPGYTGFNDHHNMFANYRTQWASFDGAPRNYSLSYHGALTDRVGLGAGLGAEKLGETTRTRAHLAYAYRFGDTDWRMSIGLATEFEDYKISGSVLSNPFIQQQDPIIDELVDGAQFFNLNFGFYGEYLETLLVGVSAPDMVRARIDEDDASQGVDNEFFEYFTVFLGYRFGMEDYDIKFEPSILMKRVRTVDFAVDVNLKMSFLDEQLIGGLSYSVGEGDRFGFLIGTKLSNLRIYYSYDVSFQDFQDYTNGSHDITLGISWPRRTE